MSGAAPVEASSCASRTAADWSPASVSVSPHPSGWQREVVEEIAADFARGHRDALHLGQAEAQRRLRQHVVLNLAPELELALDALLTDDCALVGFDVGGHLIERMRKIADLIARFQ